jgi:site-specific recombinase XerC
VRNRAILSIFLDAGLRLSELVNLTLDSFFSTLLVYCLIKNLNN